jgi:hypothetical protein
MTGHTWAADLPPFDEDAGCPKCASGAISVIFHFIHTDGFPCESSGEWVIGGHLCRVCQRCGYGWCEAPVDAKPAHRPDLRAVGTENGSQARQPGMRGDGDG